MYARNKHTYALGMMSLLHDSFHSAVIGGVSLSISLPAIWLSLVW